MAKKRKSTPNAPPASKDKPHVINEKLLSAPTLWYRNKVQLGLVAALILVTAICFSPVLSSTKEFINFDDPVYITHTDLITKLDAKHLKTIFGGHDASLNYHPITILSLAINYSFSKLRPFGYFFTNLLIHLLNTLLVFIFLYRLSGRKFWVGCIAAMLFGIHPMHVESVAWASERKDVLYCFFFLASCITYLSYMETKRIKYLVFCFVLFLCSCLSKAMAVPLPVVLLLIDFYRQRKFTLKTIAEKIPFFLLSLALGYAAVKIQSQGAISDFKQFTILQRLMFASYGCMMYLQKLVFPVGLSAFYPYPTLNQGEVPFIYKIAPAVTLIILAVPLFISFKKNKDAFRYWAFGFGFFILMVALVLQFLSVGAAIMADRYSYVPYIGVFFIIASILNYFIERKKSRIIAIAFLIMITPALAYTCYSRVKVWQNDEIVWSDVIEKYPYITETHGDVITVLQEGVGIAYDNRANYYRLHGDMEKAFADYEIMARYHTKSLGVYNNLGNIYCMKAQEASSKGDKQLTAGFYTKAIDMYSEVIRLKPTDMDALHNRGVTYSGMGEHRKALDDFNAALALDSGQTTLLAAAANEKLQLGMTEEAINDFNRALSVNPDDVEALFDRGTAYVNSGRYTEGINDLMRTVKINPANGNAWFNLSFAYNKVNNREKALEAAQNAKNAGYPVSDDYLKGLRASN